MKKHTRTPDSVSLPIGTFRIRDKGLGWKFGELDRSDFVFYNYLWRTAEFFACLLTVLLPIKFASFVSAPEAGALYWSDPVSLLVIAWPLPVFMMATPCLLFLTALAALFRKEMTFRPPLLKYGALWLVLGGVSYLGMADASCMGYPPQMIAHTLSLAAYAMSLSILLAGNDRFARMLTGALVLGGVLSLCSGLYQYWHGFDALREFVQKQSEAAGREIAADGMAIRIQEGRVQADFNSCNVYGAYLAALLPFLTVLFWRFGNERVSPPKLSRRLFGCLAFAVTLFLLVKTDSRGAVFSLLASVAVVFFFSRLPRKWKLAGAGLLFLGVAGLIVIVKFGRGALSMYVRFDYVQAAARMMFEHPLTGTGWGDFLHDYSILRLWRDKEAAHSPHNMVMLFGSQCGIAGFLAALAVLAYPVVEACRQIRRTDWRNLQSVFAVVPAFSCLILSVGTLLDIGFETTAYAGVLIAFSLLTLNRDASVSAGPLVDHCGPRLCRGVAVPLAVFCGISFFGAERFFRAEKTYSQLIAELNPEYSFEHQGDPGYVPSFDRVRSMHQAANEEAPRSPFHWNAVADYMYMTGRMDEAMTCIDMAVKLDPLQSSHYVKRARFSYAKNLLMLRVMVLDSRMHLDIVSVTPDEQRDLATARRLAPKNPELNRPDADICREAFTPKEPRP